MAKSSAKNSPSIWIGAALGALTSLTLIGLLSLGDSLFGFPFVPYDIFDWMARVLPGALIRAVIATMVTIITLVQGFLPIGDTSTVAKTAEQTIAIFQLIAGGAIFGALLAWINRRRNISDYGPIGGIILLLLTLFIEVSLGALEIISLATGWLVVLFVGWGWLIAKLIQMSVADDVTLGDQELSRRQFLTVSGTSLAVAALGTWGIGRIFGQDTLAEQTASTPAPVSGDDPFGAALTSGPAASPSPAELAARTAPVQGTRPELTSNADFYRIDINTRPPEVNAGDWRLRVYGLVNSALELSLEEIRAMPAQTQILTMACISNPVGGDLTSSTRWTGVLCKDLLAQAEVQPGALGAFINSVDGFYEFVSMADLNDERSMFVYDMNGEPLPTEHGFPLRIYIPNRYGMKQPKWIETIDLVADEMTGYWVERGWSRDAFAKTVSVVDTVLVENDTAVAGGVAWAGARGISKVEVQVDEGAWTEAELIDPPLSPLNWILWRFSWPYVAGRRTINVRAYDGDGQLQVTERQGTFPDGATGIHSATVNL
jgi:DMSO/TMAO reductase YedYZ molybdopterin-dependent catalytic subunit